MQRNLGCFEYHLYDGEVSLSMALWISSQRRERACDVCRYIWTENVLTDEDTEGFRFDRSQRGMKWT
jgi:hypothetical protein